MKLYRFETPEDTHCVAAQDEQHAREELYFYYVKAGYLTSDQADSIRPECDGVEYPSWQEFLDKHKPIENHLVEDAPHDGLMFETYEEERDFVAAHANEQIFTLVETEGYTYVVPGFHIVNRLGYLLVEQPWDNREIIYLTD